MWYEKRLHPQIREMVQQVETSGGETEALDTQAGCIAFFFGSVLIFFLIAFLRYQDALSAVLLLASLGALVGVLLYLNAAWQRVRAQRLRQALAQLRRRSNERSAQHAYLQLVLDMMEAFSLERPFQSSLMEQANGLLECALQLERYQRQLVFPPLGALYESRQRLQAKLEQSDDPVARQALEDSLRLLEERIGARQQAAVYLQRIDALQELILQMFGSLQESLKRLRTMPGERDEVDIGSLYERLTAVQQETRAIAQALQELQQLDT